MDARLVPALTAYGRIIKAHGWAAGEPFIERTARRIPEFRRWAHALGIMLRAEELLDGDEPWRRLPQAD